MDVAKQRKMIAVLGGGERQARHQTLHGLSR
jgi:hypothetical protein